MNVEQIKEAQPVSTFLETEIGKRFFSTRNSFNWFLRTHKPELSEHGAIAMLGGRMIVVPSKFEQAMAAVAKPVA